MTYCLKAAMGTGPNVASTALASMTTDPPPLFTWPVDTDLIFTENSNKIMLTSQRPLLQVIIAEVIENVRACILFENAFPDFMLVISYVKQSLITAVEAHKPGANCI